MDNILHETYLYDEGRPYIYNYKDYPTKALHWHRDIEIIYMKSGIAKVIYDNDTYTIASGEVIVINSNTFHSLSTTPESKLCRLIIQSSFLVEIFSINIYGTIFEIKITSDSLKKLFDDLIEESKSLNFASNIMQDILVRTILVELYRIHATFGTVDEIDTEINHKSYLKKALRYIDEHFLEDLTIDKISKHIHFSKSYFCTKFKEHTDMTVFEYINTLRIHHAKELMLQKDYNASKAALESGFNNIPYFTSTFRKFVGYSPSEFMSKNSRTGLSKVSRFGKWPKKKKETYYQSIVGADYCVVWAEECALTHSHWYSDNFNRLKPLEHGYYSSGDSKYLNKVFLYLKSIGVDYLLLQDTNGHWNDLGYIARNISNCFKIAEQLKDNAPRLAITTGLALRNGDIPLQQSEMDLIFYEYVKKHPTTYFKWDNKPLLVLMISEAVKMINEISDPRFTIRYGTGFVMQQDFLNLDNENSKAKYAFLQEKGNWAHVFDKQNLSSELFAVQPGYNARHRNKSYYIDRDNGNHYINLWLNAIKTNPKTIRIATYNSHQDETSIEAAIPIGDDIDETYDPYLYEKITEAYLALKHGFIDGFYYREETSDLIYRANRDQLVSLSNEDIKNIPSIEPIIIIPDDYIHWHNQS